MKNIFLAFALFTISHYSKAVELKDFSIYGKVALVSTLDFEKGSQGLGDNSSRIGIKYEQSEVMEGWAAGLNGEWSINTNRNNSGFGSSNFDGKQYDVVSNNGPFGNRLGYLWLRNENFEISAGKMWSVYYDIAEYTDLFETDGARASSVYTRTGEIDGTYRASEVIQLRYNYKKLRLGLQTKLTGKEAVEYDFDNDGTPDSSLVYKQAQAASLQYVDEVITAGVSALNLIFDNNGVSESQLSLAYGLKLSLGNFLINTVYTRAKDLELTADNRFVHSEGLEFIVGHYIGENMRALLGVNRQTRSESADFELLYYYAAYAIDIKKLRLAAEYIISDSTNNNGSKDQENKLKLAASLSF